MTKERSAGYSRHSWLCYGLFLICALLIKPVQNYLDSHLDGGRQGPDLLYFNSPALIQKMALGYDSLFADFYWMRAIQYYGRRDEASKRPVRYKNLPALLEITTTLDPDLLDAYRSGSSFLAEPDPIGAGQPGEALKLLDKGIRAHPHEWGLYYNKGFVYYWFLQDYKSAGEAWLSASRIPDAPKWLPGLAAMSLSTGGAIETAISLWQRQYRESNRADIRDNARNHLISIEVARELWKLESLIEKFKADTGSYPRSLQELVSGQKHKYEIVDPLGTPYQYDRQTGTVRLSPDSKVRYLPIPEIYKKQFTIDD
jgi:tetratricopeptide (TPR) repeat protein